MQSRQCRGIRRAAEAGQRRCSVHLGCDATVEGVGVAKDAEQAALWFRRAAEAGHTEAQYNLGVCYFKR